MTVDRAPIAVRAEVRSMPRSGTHRTSRPRRAGPSNLLADAGSIALLALVLLGLVGLGYRALRPGGWLGTTLDYLWEKSPGLVWLVAFAIVLGGAVARHLFFPRRQQPFQSDLLLYAGVALGLFFLFKLIVTGSF
jgi:hypothetical protein